MGPLPSAPQVWVSGTTMAANTCTRSTPINSARERELYFLPRLMLCQGNLQDIFYLLPESLSEPESSPRNRPRFTGSAFMGYWPTGRAKKGVKAGSNRGVKLWEGLGASK